MATRAGGTVNLIQIQFEWGAWLDDRKATAPRPRRASPPTTSSDTAPKLTAKASSSRTTSHSSWPKRTIYPCRLISMSRRRRCCRWQCDLHIEESPACLAAYRGVPNFVSSKRLTLSSDINTSAFVVPILAGQNKNSWDLHLCAQGVSCPCFSLKYSYTQMCKRFRSTLSERQPNALNPGEPAGDAIIQTPQRRHRVGPIPSIQSRIHPRRGIDRPSHSCIRRGLPSGSRRAQDVCRKSPRDSGQIGQKKCPDGALTPSGPST